MSKKQGFQAALGDIYIYQDNGTISDAAGIDSEVNVFRIVAINGEGAAPVPSFQQIAIDPFGLVLVTNPYTTGEINLITTGTGSINVSSSHGIVLNQNTGSLQVLPFDAYGVIQTDSSHNLFTSNGSDGQVLIGANAGAQALWRNITSIDGSFSILDTENGIDLSSDGTSPAVFGSNQFFAYLPTTLSPAAFFPFNFWLYGTAGYPFVKLYDIDNVVYPGDGVNNKLTITAPANGIYYISAGTTISVPSGHQAAQCNFVFQQSNSSNFPVRFYDTGLPVLGMGSLLGTNMPEEINCGFITTMTKGDYFTVTVENTMTGFDTPGRLVLGNDGGNTFFTWIQGYRIA
jgi:hypothetical protein